MLQVRQRELTDEEVPVGMAGPFHVAKGFRLNGLESIKGREALDLYQLRIQIGVEAEIHLNKERVRRLIRDAKLRRDRVRGGFQVLGIRDQLRRQLLAVRNHST